MKTCSRCRQSKPLDQFHKASKRKDGLHSYCKRCSADAQREWKQRNPKKVYAKHLKRKHKISKEEATRLAEGREEGCEICGSTEVIVDHCHRRNKIRGFLCRSCNSGIGFLQDDPKLLEKAANYIRKYERIDGE